VSERPSFSLTVDQHERFKFDIAFDNPSWAPLRTDEPEPLGEGSAPNPSRLLAAAVGNCLSASLLFCLEKARVPVAHIRAIVEVSVARNDRGRLRIASMRVTLEPTVDDVPHERLERCVDLFEDFCIVTQSVREGFDIEVDVKAQGPVAAGG
jgi:uncharacterized OsmC-like protein